MAIARHPGASPDEPAVALDAALQPFLMLAVRSSGPTLQRVSSTQLQALLLIERYGQLSIGALADLLGALPSSVTRLTHRLAAADLLRRQTGERDRRVVNLELTTAGTRLVREVRQARTAALARALPHLSGVAQRRLVADLTLLGELLDNDPVPTGRSAQQPCG